MLIKSQLLSVMSGSLDATVASHNRFGRYLRAKTIPTNPNTGLQGSVRDAMAQLVERWSATLTAAQRDAWATYAANVPVSNRVGDTIYLTALNQYIRSNVPRLQSGLSVVDDGPTTLSLPAFTIFSVTPDESSNNLSIVFYPPDGWTSEPTGGLLVYATRPQPATVNFNALSFRYAGKQIGATPTPPTSPATITYPFPGEMTAGNVVFTRIRCTRADGRLSVPQLVRSVVVA